MLFELTREINRLCGMNDDEAAALATTLKYRECAGFA
ncbi:hypothetical protein [Klebsiella pneumoniae]